MRDTTFFYLIFTLLRCLSLKKFNPASWNAFMGFQGMKIFTILTFLKIHWTRSYKSPETTSSWHVELSSGALCRVSSWYIRTWQCILGGGDSWGRVHHVHKQCQYGAWPWEGVHYRYDVHMYTLYRCTKCTSITGFYPLFANMNHDCQCNTKTVKLPDNKLEVRAVKRIVKPKS